MCPFCLFLSPSSGGVEGGGLRTLRSQSRKVALRTPWGAHPSSALRQGLFLGAKCHSSPSAGKGPAGVPGAQGKRSLEEGKTCSFRTC